MRYPFQDLSVTDPAERARYTAAMDRVLAHGQLLLGPEVTDFEAAMAEACGRRSAVGSGSGTAALYLALRAAGVGPGNEVVVPALSWPATAGAVLVTGATPVLVDVTDDMTLDPAAAEAAVTSRTKALLPVHYNGRLAAMDTLADLARRRALWLIEDAAQAFGAERDGRPAGNWGHLACFSMNPMKVLAAVGEAGAVVTDDPALDAALRTLRYNGMRDRETCVTPAFNSRLDTVQAAVLLERLPGAAAAAAHRRALAAAYDAALPDAAARPVTARERDDVVFMYPVLHDARDALQAALAQKGVEAKTRAGDHLPAQPGLAGARITDAPRAAALAGRALCLPVHAGMTLDDARSVADLVGEAVREVAA